VGFLDKLNKTVGSLREQVEKSGVVDKVKAAAQQAGSSGSASATTSAPASGPQPVAEGADLADKQWWPTAADVSAISGVDVGEPEPIETAAADGDAQFLCYVGCADAPFYASASSPGVDESKTTERILRKLLDWPE
jgi:hypothetical protein